jgi:uncharacterized integral membrane protein
MRIKTIIIIIITVLLTVVIMQNNEPVRFTFLFVDFHTTKLVMLLLVAIVAFIIGVLIGRPGKPKYVRGLEDEMELKNKDTGTLSDEDREYIN